ncbi:Saccharopine dehydrogenase [Emydomyces testavorans]|uniref:Saccharopine dehydrogenase [NAD(+), L-lysine-forming] n=1 Tax=Emydomyces testavorans TaxID=2070801 RepID=A0AAF0DQ15_9EURO|nr:Saccharopine dehydrogenase [Emydomyces testavorans]
MSSQIIHLRAEAMPMGTRALITPETAAELIATGYRIHVERSTVRVFKDSEYEQAGAILVPEGSWRNASADAVIVGTKSLPDEPFPLRHVHVYAAHVYKQQKGWAKLLSRFRDGGGVLLDFEPLADDQGNKIITFGYQAGFVAMALALKIWAHQLFQPREVDFPAVKPYDDAGILLNEARTALAAGSKLAGRLPTVIIVGARGKSGTGALQLCHQVGIPKASITAWGREDTARGGPFQEIMDHDIFINAIHVDQPIPPFVTPEILRGTRRLSVIADISNDTNNPFNPVRIYKSSTSLDRPAVAIPVSSDPPLSVTAIGYLPSLIPREASDAAARALLPAFKQLKNRKDARVWREVENLYFEKLKTLPEDANTSKARL